MTTREETWGELGPAMKALPNDRWRMFVELYLLEKPGHGAQTRAARRAGFGHPSTKPVNMARIASRLMSDDRIIAALSEEARKIVRGSAPETARALINLIRDPMHKDHARAIGMVMDRVDPITSRHEIDVTHRTADPDTEAIEELRALRKLGTSRERLLELYGANGLDRIEALEAADAVRKADAAKLIEGKVIEETVDGEG